MNRLNTNSPLKLDSPIAMGIIEMARRNQVWVVTPFTLAGATASATLDRRAGGAECRGTGLHRRWATEVWPTNWKCLIESFMEGYHLSPLHRMKLHVVNPTRLCSHHPAGDAYFGYNAGYAPILPRAKGPPGSDRGGDRQLRDVRHPARPGVGLRRRLQLLHLCATGIGRPGAGEDGPHFYGENWPKETVQVAIALFNEAMAEHKRALAGMMRGWLRAGIRRGRWRRPTSRGRCWTSTAIAAAASAMRCLGLGDGFTHTQGRSAPGPTGNP
ncbi:trimethylamine methyltransferase family protein [Dongia soli]|uniref:Trimethylamine methyltransferase family protein n=1 Tax=Dongia soli TaxID=600628 RepID=A0ABU5EGB0_9PROT|nr:trimethylamine methyltransferase family protein [Dongia soli]MDY0885445.1 trimethylamine methyltransferase family protein [Dongia soli]